MRVQVNVDHSSSHSDAVHDRSRVDRVNPGSQVVEDFEADRLGQGFHFDPYVVGLVGGGDVAAAAAGGGEMIGGQVTGGVGCFLPEP